MFNSTQVYFHYYNTSITSFILIIFLCKYITLNIYLFLQLLSLIYFYLIIQLINFTNQKHSKELAKIHQTISYLLYITTLSYFIFLQIHTIYHVQIPNITHFNKQLILSRLTLYLSRELNIKDEILKDDKKLAQFIESKEGQKINYKKVASYLENKYTYIQLYHYLKDNFCAKQYQPLDKDVKNYIKNYVRNQINTDKKLGSNDIQQIVDLYENKYHKVTVGQYFYNTKNSIQKKINQQKEEEEFKQRQHRVQYGLKTNDKQRKQKMQEIQQLAAQLLVFDVISTSSSEKSE